MWKSRIVLREIWRSLVTSGWRTLLLLFVSAGLLYAVATTELRVAENALTTEQAQTASGKYTYSASAIPTATTTAATGLDGGRCLALEYRSHVVASGGFTLRDSVTIARAPGVRTELVDIVGPMQALWDSSLQADTYPERGLWISTALATSIGFRPGSEILLDGLPPTQVGVFDPSRRSPEAAIWIAGLVAPTTPVSQCWVEFAPASAEAGATALRSWFAGYGITVSVAPVLVAGKFSLNPVADFDQRPNRFAWFPAGVSLGLVFAVVGWFKRSEIALYRTLGSGIAQTAVIFVAQGVVILIGAWLFSTSVMAITFVEALDNFGQDPMRLGLRSGLLASLLGVALQTPVLVLLARGETAYQIKDRG